MSQVKLSNEEARNMGLDAPKPNKYHNVPVKVDGHTFHSQKEAKRYGELKLLQQAGKINSLEPHPGWIYWSEDNETAIFRYWADFKYWDCHKQSWIYEDVKAVDSKTGKTPESPAYRLFKLKKKLIEDRFGITITEV